MSFAGGRAPARGNRKERIVYRCIGEKKNKACKNKTIRQDVVEEIVIYELDRILSNEGIDDMIDMLYKDMSKKLMDLPSVIKKAELELNKTTNDIDKLIDMALATSFNDSIKNKI